MTAIAITLTGLETPCNRCNGMGIIQAPAWAQFWSEHPTYPRDATPADHEEMDRLCEQSPEEIGCPPCSGVGTIPTEDGLRLLAFVRKYMVSR